MQLNNLLQRSLAVLPLILAVEARALTVDLIPRSDKLDTRPSGKWHSGVLERSNAAATTSNIPLVDWFNRTDTQWYTTIDIGTPPQKITVLLTPFSLPLLIPAGNCTLCSTQYKFHPGNSSTFTPGHEIHEYLYLFSTGWDSRPISHPFGATCRLNNDTVSLGDLRVETQLFALCDEYDPEMNVMPIAGALGLDLYNPTAPEKSLLWNLWEHGQLENPVFSVYMPPGHLKGGQLTLGGTDKTKYTGDFQAVNLHLDSKGLADYWWVYMPKVYANDHQLDNSTPGNWSPLYPSYAILDMTTAFIQVPNNETAARLYSQISPKFEVIDPAGAWGVPCEEMAALAPSLTFTFSNSPSDGFPDGSAFVNLTIPSQSFNLGEYPTKKGYCQGVFNSPQNTFYGDFRTVWVLGSPFLKNFYTSYNGLNKTVHFAELAT